MVETSSLLRNRTSKGYRGSESLTLRHSRQSLNTHEVMDENDVKSVINSGQDVYVFINGVAGIDAYFERDIFIPSNWLKMSREKGRFSKAVN